MKSEWAGFGPRGILVPLLVFVLVLLPPIIEAE
jgi:hypothetical protein